MSNLSSYLGFLPGFYSIQGSLLLVGRTKTCMTGVSKIIESLTKGANNRKVAKKLPELVDLRGKMLVGDRPNHSCHLHHNIAAKSQPPPKKHNG